VTASHVNCVRSRRGMARPKEADGGGSLEIWRVGATILNKQSRTAVKGWYSCLGVRPGANNPSS
jgi:hypothetical protein